jgi:hypothetical protein
MKKGRRVGNRIGTNQNSSQDSNRTNSDGAKVRAGVAGSEQTRGTSHANTVKDGESLP